MSNDVNIWIGTGRLTHDPRQFTANGTIGCNFDIATNKTRIDSNGRKVETTMFTTCTVWKNRAIAVLKYLRKGREVHVMGPLQDNTWVDKTTGQNRSKRECWPNDIRFQGGTTQTEAPSQSERHYSDAPLPNAAEVTPTIREIPQEGRTHIEPEYDGGDRDVAQPTKPQKKATRKRKPRKKPAPIGG